MFVCGGAPQGPMGEIAEVQKKNMLVKKKKKESLKNVFW